MKPEKLFVAICFLLPLILLSCEEEEENQLPAVQMLSPDNGAQHDIGEEVLISVEASDPDGIISEVRFFIDNIGVGSVQSFPYNFTWATSGEEEGVHDIKVTAIDNNSGSSSAEIVVFLFPSGSPPSADFSANFTSIVEGDTVWFTDLSVDAPTSWAWNFGDGGSSEEQNPWHVYENPGTYTVELTVSNEFGSDTQTRTDYIIVEESVSTGNTGTFIDPRDDKEYKTVKIGNQWWMAENLAYLPEVSPSSDESSTLPKYYVYGYQGNGAEKVKTTDNYKTYGVLYNWPAAMNACPEGWHLPLDEEWELLAANISVDQGSYTKDADDWINLGIHLKSNSGWEGGGHGTDDYGFTALAAGERGSSGDFERMTYEGYWWSATEAAGTDAWIRSLTSSTDDFYRYYIFKESGFSVRCVRD